MDQVIEQVIVVPQEELNEDLAATHAAFFNPDGTPFSFSEGTPGEGVSEEFVTEAIGSAVNGLATETYVGEQLDSFGGGVQEYIDGLVNGLASEAFVGEAVSGLVTQGDINEAVTGLATEEFVGEAVTGLASEAFVGDTIGEAIGEAMEGVADETFVTTSLATAVSGILGGAGADSDTMSELANLIAVRITTGLIDAKGDLIVGTADNTPARKAVGSGGSVLKVNSTQSDGLIWGWPESGLEHYTKPAGSYQSFPRQMGLADQALLGTGRYSFVAIYLPKGLTVTNLQFVSLTTPASVPTHWWFVLCDDTFHQLGSTADQGTEAWGANTWKQKALATPFVTTYEGLYYIGLCMVATTPISMVAASQNSVPVNSIVPLVSCHGLTGQTAPAADGTLLANPPANQSAMMWAYVT